MSLFILSPPLPRSNVAKLYNIRDDAEGNGGDNSIGPSEEHGGRKAAAGRAHADGEVGIENSGNVPTSTRPTSTSKKQSTGKQRRRKSFGMGRTTKGKNKKAERATGGASPGTASRRARELLAITRRERVAASGADANANAHAETTLRTPRQRSSLEKVKRQNAYLSNSKDALSEKKLTAEIGAR